MATNCEAKLERVFARVKVMTEFKPLVALVLGSGLGDYARSLRIEQEIPYSEIEEFPVSTVPGHEGKFYLGWLDSVPVICMKGRVHFYEGYPVEDVVMPIRLMKLLGAKYLFLTNAAGGLNESFVPGDLMMIRDHLSFFVPNPLIGPNAESLGTRFPDMSCVYDGELRELIRETAKREGICLREGVYAQLTGPSYESPAEIRALQTLGTDAVGMSTVVEAIAAKHAGMKICGISCISNLAAGLSKKTLDHKEVQETADSVAGKFTALVSGVIRRMGELVGV